MEHGRGTLSLPQAIEKIWQDEAILQQNFERVYCFADSLQFSLVPASLRLNEEVLDITHGPMFNEVHRTDHIQNPPVQNHYRIDRDLQPVLEKLFTYADIENSTSCLLRSMEDTSEGLTAIIFQNTLKIFLFSDSELKIAKHFTYSTATDAVYHLLNVCRQFGKDPSEINLSLTGLVDKESILYQEIYKYFLHIDLRTFDRMNVSESFDQYPKHYFSHLFTIASCVS